MDFNYLPQIAQPWTGSSIALTAGIGKFVAYGGSRIGGTALLTAVYQACLNQFDKIDHAASGNFILLFSDREDNASRTDLRQAVNICHHANTAIYAFRAESKYSYSQARKHWPNLPLRSAAKSSTMTTQVLELTKTCNLLRRIFEISITSSTNRHG